jgi:hypothetical protein
MILNDTRGRQNYTFKSNSIIYRLIHGVTNGLQAHIFANDRDNTQPLNGVVSALPLPERFKKKCGRSERELLGIWRGFGWLNVRLFLRPSRPLRPLRGVSASPAALESFRI